MDAYFFNPCHNYYQSYGSTNSVVGVTPIYIPCKQPSAGLGMKLPKQMPRCNTVLSGSTA